MSKLENLLKIVKSVESTHRGVGVPLSFNVLSILAGQSVFDVASSGSCKTHMIYSIIEAMKSFPRVKIDNWNSMTYYELLERIGVQTNLDLLWTVEEWSMLSPYHQDLLMAIASKVQTDKNFERLVSKGGFTAQIKLTNCNLMILICIQPYKFRKLMKESDSWNSMASDRFIKFPLINGIRESTKKDPPRFELPDSIYQSKSMEQRPNPILVRLFDNHLTQSRSELAAIHYQEAWCRMNERDYFTDVDAIQFSALYSVYLELYPLMIKSVDPDQEESFYTGPFRIIEHFMKHFGESQTVQDVEDAFHMVNIDEEKKMSERTIYRHLRVLESKGIISRNSPDYSLSPRYTKYFDNYRENWK